MTSTISRTTRRSRPGCSGEGPENVTDFSDKPDGGGAPTSLSLLARVKARQEAAWERLVALYGPLVYSWCLRAGLQPADAADVGQDVFTAVLRNIASFRRDRPGDTFR